MHILNVIYNTRVPTMTLASWKNNKDMLKYALFFMKAQFLKKFTCCVKPTLKQKAIS